jgi:hypothetical protein
MQETAEGDGAGERATSRLRLGWEIAAASFIVLFQELALIRWLPGQVRVLAYFPNLVLISAFLGLGLGALRSRGRPFLWMWPASLTLLTAAAWSMSGIAFTQSGVSEHLWLLYFDLPRTAPVVDGIRLPIVLCFVLTAVSFIPLGQFVARRLKILGDSGDSLYGYGCDLGGSLLGVILFAATCFLQWFPIAWFVTILGAGVFLCLGHRRVMLIHILCGLAVIALVWRAENASWYSPYYALRLGRDPVDSSLSILTNGSLHQSMLPLRKADRPPNWQQAAIREGYHIPYRLLRSVPKRVLVLGAGSGNDVAVALDEGAEQIDAVEIDPVIIDIGARLHPDHPYSSPRVRVFNTDARAFLNHTDGKYDLIVFGTLDSMTRLSALSNVRLDNFVYTSDCLRAASRHLGENAVIAMYYMVSVPYIEDRLAGMLMAAVRNQPLVVARGYRKFNRIYMAGPHFPHAAQLTAAEQPPLESLNLPTDDWPYLYLERRGVSAFYLSLIGIFAVLSIASLLVVSPELRASVLRGRIDKEMFFFGMAFLLLEAKLTTEMNLVWGSTWLTSAVVFASVLIMILAGTLLTRVHPLAWRSAAIALIVSLVLCYLFPIGRVAGFSVLIRLLASLLYVGFPVFFASICFALLFAQRSDPNLAFGWNLLGAVFGGLLEFLSMALGLKAMILLAILAYLAAIFFESTGRSRPKASEV